jgi:hypothetical protein
MERHGYTHLRGIMNEQIFLLISRINHYTDVHVI